MVWKTVLVAQVFKTCLNNIDAIVLKRVKYYQIDPNVKYANMCGIRLSLFTDIKANCILATLPYKFANLKLAILPSNSLVN